MEGGHKRWKMMVSWGHPQMEERKGRRAVIRKGVIIILLIIMEGNKEPAQLKRIEWTDTLVGR